MTHACIVAFSFQFFPAMQLGSTGSIAKARYVDNFGRIGDLDINLNPGSGLLYGAHAECAKSFAHVFSWFVWILHTQCHDVSICFKYDLISIHIWLYVYDCIQVI